MAHVIELQDFNNNWYKHDVALNQIQFLKDYSTRVWLPKNLLSLHVKLNRHFVTELSQISVSYFDALKYLYINVDLIGTFFAGLVDIETIDFAGQVNNARITKQTLYNNQHVFKNCSDLHILY